MIVRAVQVEIISARTADLYLYEDRLEGEKNVGTVRA